MATILVVDDEFGVAEVLQAILSDAGHRVVIAINGRQGLEMLAREAPALVFLDFMMPILDGAGMLGAMAADPATAAIPVILMSSLPEATVSERARGYAAFLRKPFRVQAILEAAEAALGGADRR